MNKLNLVLFFLLYGYLVYGQVNLNSFETGKLKKESTTQKSDSVNIYGDTISRNIYKTIEQYLPGHFFSFPTAGETSIEDNLNTIYGNDGFSVGNNINISFSKNGGALYSELVSDFLYLSRFAGYAKVGFGMQVQSSKDSIITSLNNFFTKGGNFVLYVNYPIIYWYGENKGKKLSRGDISFVPKVAGELPQLNSTINNPTLNIDLGLEGDFSLCSISSKLQFFSLFRTGYLMWGTDEFYKSINLTENEKRNFFYTNMYIGLEINGTYRISVSKPIWPTPFNFKKDTPVSFTLSFIPDKGKSEGKKGN